ncbi:MAG: hypothetical protein H7329_12530 [Opitutaceae bacterium]|nr:hypothetical protein [Cytophagales bacterium]
MNIKNCLIFSVTFSLLLFSCKGPKGDPGPIGEKGISGSNGNSYDDNFSEGYINGKVTGIGPEGKSYLIPFNLTTGGFQDESYNYTMVGDSIQFWISRGDYTRKDSLTFGSLSLRFKLKSFYSKESISSNSQLTYEFHKREKDGNIYKVSQNLYNLRITALNYDSLTKILKGDFEAEQKNVDLGKSYIRGSFSSPVWKLLNYRKE